jgi:hypothetical protein
MREKYDGQEWTMSSTPNVFIIESLDIEDETHKRFEGKFLSHILRQTGVKVHYSYVRTLVEFERALAKFSNSGFRYLHISCHANKKGIYLTEEGIRVAKLAGLLRPRLKKRRIFFSACQFVTLELAKALLGDTECYSVIGPSVDVGFDEAAIFWASLYHVMLRDEAQSMKFKELRKQVAIFAELYRVKMKYFRASGASGFKEVTLSRVGGPKPETKKAIEELENPAKRARLKRYATAGHSR